MHVRVWGGGGGWDNAHGSNLQRLDGPRGVVIPLQQGVLVQEEVSEQGHPLLQVVLKELWDWNWGRWGWGWGQGFG